MQIFFGIFQFTTTKFSYVQCACTYLHICEKKIEENVVGYDEKDKWCNGHSSIIKVNQKPTRKAAERRIPLLTKNSVHEYSTRGMEYQFQSLDVISTHKYTHTFRILKEFLLKTELFAVFPSWQFSVEQSSNDWNWYFTLWWNICESNFFVDIFFQLSKFRIECECIYKNIQSNETN